METALESVPIRTTVGICRQHHHLPASRVIHSQVATGPVAQTANLLLLNRLASDAVCTTLPEARSLEKFGAGGAVAPEVI